ncbi:hypothetical protein BDV59DRAFT_201987 [Aspergillus ambiguus]|uniref:uncharacterized protein n=1 Tax=Aspergillus ambiguus TaxID=176160 RepID=UPI003CCE1658
MANTDKTYAQVGVHKRSTLRLECRNVLSKHIANTLGFHVKPCDVRLKIDDEDTQYAWHVEDPSIQALFEKQLSKHSVGAYIALTEEVGRAFWAVPRREVNEESSPPAPRDLCEELKEENTILTEKLLVVERDGNCTRREKEAMEKEIRQLKEKLDDAQGTITATQNEAQKWMAHAEYYRMSFSQWLGRLNQVTHVLQGLAALGYQKATFLKD